MPKIVLSGMVALLMILMPLVAMAQSTGFDEEAQAIAQEMVQRVGATLAPGVVSTAASNGATEPEIASEPDEAEEPGAPMPQFEEPAAEPEPDDDPLGLPELNLTDLVEYSSQGLTILVPADWIVESGLSEETPFDIGVPGTDFRIAVEADTALDFPSWLGVALFRSQSELLVQGMGEEVELVESTTLYTEQDLPMAKIVFEGVIANQEAAGALYVVAPNENAYVIYGAGSVAEWEYAAAGLEAIVQSIVFDEDLITAVRAGEEPLRFTDADESMELMIPAGWYAVDSGDPTLPIILAEPEVRFVVATATENSFDEELDPEIFDLVPEDGELAPEDYDEFYEAVMDVITASGSPIIIDDELSSLVTREGAVTARLVGEADLDDGLSIPVIFYFDLRLDSAGVAVVFGDIESALAVEEELQALLESITRL